MFAGKCAVVTGSGTGLGEACARTLADQHASVVVADIDASAVETVAESLRQDGHDAIAVTVDVAHDDEVAAMVDHVMTTFGRIDILVNNAGLAREHVDMCSDLSTELWMRFFAVNVMGALICSRACRPIMANAGGGVIVNQSSAGAHHNVIGAYHVTKLALNGLTVALATEYAADGIRVNAMAPGSLSQRAPREMLDRLLNDQLVKRLGTPGDLAGALLFLCSDASSFITGQILAVDGGLVLRP